MHDRFLAAQSLSKSLSRRRLLQAGALGTLSLGLPRLLAAETAEAAPAAKAKSCILYFMEGGPSHIDLWDMKPDAPENVRGPFKPIATSLPGMQVCEHLPQLARVMDRFCVVHSMSHTLVDHNASSYLALSGHSPFRDGNLIRGPSPQNAPPFGSVVAKLRPTGGRLPDYVHVPKQFFNCGDFIPGVLGGFLGEEYDPFIAGDPSELNYRVPGLTLEMPLAAFERRRHLQGELDRSFTGIGPSASVARMNTFYDKAWSLISAPDAQRAFDLSQEPESVRLRYGLRHTVSGVRGDGMPHLGQSMLLARRLVEAGVRLVSVWAGGQAFDGHQLLYPSLITGLCPPTDRALSALIEDLEERGLLDETLVVAIAEFGRTPKLGQITSTAGADPNGRDHWPNCYTAFLAGAGVKAGTIYGASDNLGAYPRENPVSPMDLAATIYTILGVDPESRIYDRSNRPHSVSEGRPIAGILA